MKTRAGATLHDMKRIHSLLLASFVCAIPVFAGDQTPVPPKTGSLEFRLQAESIVAGVPQDFTFQLVNNTDHDVRLPKPLIAC
jgi:hypothetical protein